MSAGSHLAFMRLFTLYQEGIGAKKGKSQTALGEGYSL
jgi:hypothetical protein